MNSQHLVVASPARLWASRLGLLIVTAWSGFWLWFILMSVLSEGPASYGPGLSMGLGFAAIALAGWWRRRIGGVLALFAAGFIAWYFSGSTSIWLLVAPPLVGGALMLIAPPRRVRPGGSPAASAGRVQSQPS